MLSGAVVCLVALSLLVSQAAAAPAHEGRKPLSAVSELSARLGSHQPRLTQDPRLPLPTPQDIEAIKKVAQILVMLGEQLRERARPRLWLDLPSTVARQAIKGMVNLSDSQGTSKLKVIPTILGDSSSSPSNSHGVPIVVEDPPNDPVN